MPVDYASLLAAHGLSEREAANKMRLFAECATALRALPDAAKDDSHPLAFFVPGRIEVLGKHTDYAGGRSLLCAMERGFTVLARARQDGVVRVVAAQSRQTRQLHVTTSAHGERGDWSNYVATVVRGVARNFPSATRGADIAFASDLPSSSGMSSSSALVIAIFLVMAKINDLAMNEDYARVITSPEMLAGFLGAVENGRSFGTLGGDTGVGTLGGSQDQTAILCCRAGVLSQYAFGPVRAEREVAFIPGKTFVVAYSGVAASKTSNALLQYNEASLAVSEILARWNTSTSRDDGTLAEAVESAPEAPERIRELLHTSHSPRFTTQRLLDRYDQFVTESYDIIPRATEAVAKGDLEAFGELVARSQQGAELRLGNQIPETVALVASARALGADAASAFGAGFGGSVWALVSSKSATRFTHAWRHAYSADFPEAGAHAEMFVTLPGPGAVLL